jgi:prepilin-type N-terminal cleavage/methylation domain-containing protein
MTNSSHSFTARRQKCFGFTLLEVLVGAAILAIVMSVMLGILSSGLSLWRNTQGKIEVDAEGRAGALLLMQDIDNIIMPASPKLWPSVMTSQGVPYFRFLTLKPHDYQDLGKGENVGDVCYVEYYFAPEGMLMRRFYSSKWTYENILKSGELPLPGREGAQLLSTNLLHELRDSVRGSSLFGEAGTTGFILLAINNPGQKGSLLPHRGPLDINNPPVGVEINFAATDMLSAQNPQLLDNAAYRLRNAGYFSLRYDLPTPIRSD